MKKLTFQSPDEFNEYFKGKSPELTNIIVSCIREAMLFNKKTAQLFEISFDGMDTVFEISLTKNQWVVALQNCLSHYEEWEMGDDAIDTYLLIKDVKAW
jgi:hypothetical protein